MKKSQSVMIFWILNANQKRTVLSGFMNIVSLKIVWACFFFVTSFECYWNRIIFFIRFICIFSRAYILENFDFIKLYYKIAYSGIKMIFLWTKSISNNYWSNLEVFICCTSSWKTFYGNLINLVEQSLNCFFYFIWNVNETLSIRFQTYMWKLVRNTVSKPTRFFK